MDKLQAQKELVSLEKELTSLFKHFKEVYGKETDGKEKLSDQDIHETF